MRYLREHGDEIAEGKKRQLERAARRREYLGGTLAAAGGSSWDALKTAAQKAADAKHKYDEGKAEKRAWRENEHRDEEEAHNRNTYRAGGDIDPDAPEVPSEDEPAAEQSRADNGLDEAADATVLPFTPRDGEDQAEQPAADTADTSTTDSKSTDSDSEPTAQKGSENTEKVKTTGPDPEKDTITDPDKGTCRISIAELHRRRAREDDERRRAEEAELRAHEAEQAQAEREHRERMAQIQQNSLPTEGGATNGITENGITESCGGLTVTTHSGEITDLTSAIAYVTTASQYCDQISGTFETTQAQANATAREMEGQLGGLETAQSSLRSFELDSEANRLAQVAERYSELVQAMQQVEEALTTAQEAISAAKSELDHSASEFQSQMGISEQVNAHDSVANDTRFYAYQ